MASDKPKIVIVGAGIAGLNAAHHLRKAGYYATIYEAQDRVGGRIYTARDRLGEGLTTELGGELIDTRHTDMLALIKEFDLPTLDRRGPTEIHLRRFGYYYDGKPRFQEDMVEDFRPVQHQLDADYARLRENPAYLEELDRVTAAEYIDQTGITGWVQTLLHTALLAMSGLEADRQTALNFFWLYPHIYEGKVFPYGKSDGKYSVLGGNSRIIEALADRIQGQIETGSQLQAVSERGSKVVLTINGKDIEADFAIIAIPFSVLRHIPLNVELKPTLKRFINEMTYGTSAKLLAGFDSRPWREAGYTGSVSSDEGFHSAWDCSQGQPTEIGSLTFYTSGELGATLNQHDLNKTAQRFVDGYSKLIPAAKTEFNGRVDIGVHWPSFEWTQGAYGCLAPGQYTSFVRVNEYVEGELQGVGTQNLLLAGEHLSDTHKGYMNGGAQTGRLVAQVLLRRL